MNATVLQGDCIEVLRALPDCSVDAVVTDPPYGLSFMGRRWDYDVPGVDVWAECLRVLKPGGHLLAFAGTRTQHRMCCRIEDAGFEIRDMIAWVYGSGFPKSLDASKAIDAAAGAEREVVATVRKTPSASSQNMNEGWRRPWAEDHPKTMDITAPSTEAAKKWQGWGTALKPALEPITVARKPLVGTVAANVLEWGTGAINVDGCRVGIDGGTRKGGSQKFGWDGSGTGQHVGVEAIDAGRWPANLIHDGSDEAISGMGGCSRYFYCPKANKADRDEGMAGFEVKAIGSLNMRSDAHAERTGALPKPRANTHPTVKPTALMRYLCRLVTPPGGVVLDPFTGSGSTGKAAALEGFRFIGIEREAEYVEIARARIAAVQPPLFT